MSHTWMWITFGVIIAGMMALDLGLLNRNAHAVKFRTAVTWVVVWILTALAFNAGVWHFFGRTKAVEFLTGYIIEYSLSMVNVFVFLLIFTYFRVPAKFQHKALFWGVLGALIMRAIMIVAGVALIQKFHWIIYIFGAFLIVTGIKMGMEKDKEIHPERNPVLRLFRKLMPVTEDYDERGRFFVKDMGRWLATPLFVVILVIETTDVVFAVDSIPAIFGITTDPFIIYTSNVFAILGLRSLFFVLAGMMRYFHHLHYGLSAILIFVGVKMVGGDYVKDHIPKFTSRDPEQVLIVVTLVVVVSLLVGSIVASLIWPRRDKTAQKG